MLKILIVVDALGPAEFIDPVIPILSKSFELRIVAVKESPAKIMKQHKPVLCNSELEAESIYKKFKPDILLVATSSLVLGPFVNNKFTELAYADKKKIVCFQDYWANHRWPMNFKMMDRWDAVITGDNLGKNFLLQDGFGGKIFVTGHPAFDKFLDVNVAKEKARLREKLKINLDAPVILHSGTGTPQSEKEDAVTFNFLAKAIREIKKEYPNLVFISRPHPRDENPSRYNQLAPDLGLLDTSSIDLTENLLPVADVVVAMYATNLIHACYLRIPAISILLPNAGKKRLEQISLTDFPPSAEGATISIYKENLSLLKETLVKSLFDRHFLRELEEKQKQFFALGNNSSAKKVAEVLSKEI